MDRGAWWAIVHRVAQSQRQLTSRDQYSAYHNHSKINGKSKVVGDIKGQMWTKPQIVCLQVLSTASQ